MIDFKVSVRCMTYNQASYIVDALNGFCMQQTSFPYVCCILDDASTDGEQNVIRKYLEDYFDLNDNSVVKNEDTDDYLLTFAQHKSNRNCYFAVFYLKYNHYKIWDRKYQYISQWEHMTKYIAMCEGDDYWTDSLKLQKQVDFLEYHPDYSLIRTNVDRFHQKEGRMEKNFFSHSRRVKDSREFYIMNSRWFATCTWLFRNIVKENDVLNGSNIDFFKGDVYLLLRLSLYGKVKYLDESTSVYRILEDTASHFRSWKDWFFFSWRCKNTRLLFARNESFSLRLKFWIKETVKVGYRAARSLDKDCLLIAFKSFRNDFCVLFIRNKSRINY